MSTPADAIPVQLDQSATATAQPASNPNTDAQNAASAASASAGIGAASASAGTGAAPASAGIGAVSASAGTSAAFASAGTNGIATVSAAATRAPVLPVSEPSQAEKKARRDEAASAGGADVDHSLPVVRQHADPVPSDELRSDFLVRALSQGYDGADAERQVQIWVQEWKHQKRVEAYNAAEAAKLSARRANTATEVGLGSEMARTAAESARLAAGRARATQMATQIADDYCVVDQLDELCGDAALARALAISQENAGSAIRRDLAPAAAADPEVLAMQARLAAAQEERYRREEAAEAQTRRSLQPSNYGSAAAAASAAGDALPSGTSGRGAERAAADYETASQLQALDLMRLSRERARGNEAAIANRSVGELHAFRQTTAGTGAAGSSVAGASQEAAAAAAGGGYDSRRDAAAGGSPAAGCDSQRAAAATPPRAAATAPTVSAAEIDTIEAFGRYRLEFPTEEEIMAAKEEGMTVEEYREMLFSMQVSLGKIPRV